jgi:hypothetical protein
MQLRIHFGLARCHTLLVVNLFSPLTDSNAGGEFLSAKISPLHNMTPLWDAPMMTILRSAKQTSHPLIIIDSAIVISIRG